MGVPINTYALQCILKSANQKGLLYQGSDLNIEGTAMWKVPQELREELDRAKKVRTNPPTLHLCEADNRLYQLTMDRENIPFYGDVWYSALFFDCHGACLAEHNPPEFELNHVAPPKLKGKSIVEAAKALSVEGKACSVMLILCDEIAGTVCHRLFYKTDGGLSQPLFPEFRTSSVRRDTPASDALF